MDNNQNHDQLDNNSVDNPAAPSSQPLAQTTIKSSTSGDSTPNSNHMATSPKKFKPPLVVLLLILILILMGAVGYGSYAYGKDQNKQVAVTTSPMNSMNSATMAVPQGATLLEQCVPGLGAQYIMPKNIPEGPIYNISKGKVIGLEYMADLSTLTSSNMVSALDLMGAKYDHVNISLMPGHAGLQASHYQIDFLFISKSQASMIKCSSSSSSSGAMSNMSM